MGIVDETEEDLMNDFGLNNNSNSNECLQEHDQTEYESPSIINGEQEKLENDRECSVEERTEETIHCDLENEEQKNEPEFLIERNDGQSNTVVNEEVHGLEITGFANQDEDFSVNQKSTLQSEKAIESNEKETKVNDDEEEDDDDENGQKKGRSNHWSERENDLKSKQVSDSTVAKSFNNNQQNFRPRPSGQQYPRLMNRPAQSSVILNSKPSTFNKNYQNIPVGRSTQDNGLLPLPFASHNLPPNQTQVPLQLLSNSQMLRPNPNPNPPQQFVTQTQSHLPSGPIHRQLNFQPPAFSEVTHFNSHRYNPHHNNVRPNFFETNQAQINPQLNNANFSFNQFQQHQHQHQMAPLGMPNQFQQQYEQRAAQMQHQMVFPYPINQQQPQQQFLPNQPLAVNFMQNVNQPVHMPMHNQQDLVQQQQQQFNQIKPSNVYINPSFVPKQQNLQHQEKEAPKSTRSRKDLDLLLEKRLAAEMSSIEENKEAKNEKKATKDKHKSSSNEKERSTAKSQVKAEKPFKRKSSESLSTKAKQEDTKPSIDQSPPPTKVSKVEPKVESSMVIIDDPDYSKKLEEQKKKREEILRQKEEKRNQRAKDMKTNVSSSTEQKQNQAESSTKRTFIQSSDANTESAKNQLQTSRVNRIVTTTSSTIKLNQTQSSTYVGSSASPSSKRLIIQSTDKNILNMCNSLNIKDKVKYQTNFII